MRAISTTIAIGTLALFMNMQVLAADAGHTSEAMEHAGKAQAHGEMGHAEESAKHSEEAMKHMRHSGH